MLAVQGEARGVDVERFERHERATTEVGLAADGAGENHAVRPHFDSAARFDGQGHRAAEGARPQMVAVAVELRDIGIAVLLGRRPKQWSAPKVHGAAEVTARVNLARARCRENRARLERGVAEAPAPQMVAGVAIAVFIGQGGGILDAGSDFAGARSEAAPVGETLVLARATDAHALGLRRTRVDAVLDSLWFASLARVMRVGFV